PTGARIEATGGMIRIGPNAGTYVVVKGYNVPVDQALYACLTPRQQKVFEMFQDQASFNELLQKGVIQSRAQQLDRLKRLDQLRDQRRQSTKAPLDDQALADLDAQITQLQKEIDLPPFELGGQISVVVHLQKKPSDEQSQSRVQIAVAG